MYSLINILQPGFCANNTVTAIDRVFVISIPNYVIIDIMKQNQLFE